MQKKLILTSCYDCPYNLMIWLEDRKDDNELEPGDDDYLVRFGCSHKKILSSEVKEDNGRLVALTDSLMDRPDIPIWCPLDDI